jgi:tetratricopeptide (TPR) repeat protein
LAELHELADVLTHALSTKANLLSLAGRSREALALFKASAEIARQGGVVGMEIAVEANLADFCMIRDLPGAEEHATAALALARRQGHRGKEAWGALNLLYILSMAGRFDEASALGTDVLQTLGEGRADVAYLEYGLACLEALRGRPEVARAHLSGCGAWAESDELQLAANYSSAEAGVLLAEGQSHQALAAASRSVGGAKRGGIEVGHETVRMAFPIAIDAALEVGALEEAGALVDWLASRPRGEVPPYLRAQLTRAKALLAAARGEHEAVEENLVAAEDALRELGYPYWTARVQLDRAEWFAGRKRLDESARLASESAATFSALGVASMLERARALLEPQTTRAGSSPLSSLDQA